MAPKSKKACKYNGYSVYVRENHQLHDVTYVEGFGVLRQQWKDLTDEEKEKYNNKAIEMNYNKKKMTTTGETYEEIEEQRLLEKRKKEEEQRWIQTKVFGIDSRKSLVDLAETSFFVIHFNKHTVTHERQVVPAEMGIVRFSLKYGIEDEVTCIIQNKKQEQPPGYAFKMRERAMETHAIPVDEQFPMAEPSTEVLNKIISFLSREITSSTINISESTQLQPVFTLDYMVERVDHTTEDEIIDTKKILQNLFEKGTETIKPPNVYDINYLFCSIWRACIQRGRNIAHFPDTMIPTALQTKLEEDMFAYECVSSDCCVFHGALENIAEHYIVKYCSLCICKRYVYTICSHLTSVISIGTECIPGYHKPTPEDTLKLNKIVDERSLKNALSMAVLKEYKNPISGVDLPKVGSMNGTTFLPQDKDPALEIKEQLKLKMQTMRITEHENSSHIDEVPKLPTEDDTSSRNNAANSIRSDGSSSRHTPTMWRRGSASSRLRARFDQEHDSRYTSEARNSTTTYHSYN